MHELASLTGHDVKGSIVDTAIDEQARSLNYRIACAASVLVAVCAAACPFALEATAGWRIACAVVVVTAVAVAAVAAGKSTRIARAARSDMRQAIRTHFGAHSGSGGGEPVEE